MEKPIRADCRKRGCSTATVVWKDGHAHHFDGAKDMFKFYLDLNRYHASKKPSDIQSIYVTSYYDLQPADATKAFYVIGSDVYGPMGHELIPLATRADAEEFMQDHQGKRILTYGQISKSLPAKLDDAEWVVMRSHSTLGHDMLKYSDRRLLRSAAIIAWQHHEKWNGTGYPCGLKGEAIHIYGRITALADVFDALASDRPYKRAWELDRIVKLFETERGAHFDPDLARIFLENVDAFVGIRKTV